jgi:hypothetical protein
MPRGMVSLWGLPEGPPRVVQQRRLLAAKPIAVDVTTTKTTSCFR